jgi:hypothetical protein
MLENEVVHRIAQRALPSCLPQQFRRGCTSFYCAVNEVFERSLESRGEARAERAAIGPRRGKPALPVVNVTALFRYMRASGSLDASRCRRREPLRRMRRFTRQREKLRKCNGTGKTIESACERLVFRRAASIVERGTRPMPPGAIDFVLLNGVTAIVRIARRPPRARRIPGTRQMRKQRVTRASGIRRRRDEARGALQRDIAALT